MFAIEHLLVMQVWHAFYRLDLTGWPNKMVLDKMVRTKWYGQNGTDKMVRTKW